MTQATRSLRGSARVRSGALLLTAALGAAAALTAMLLRTLRPVPMLESVAATVVPKPESAVHDWLGLFWLSNSDALLPHMETGSGAAAWQFDRMDMRTGVVAPMSALNRLAMGARFPPLNPGGMFEGRLSPDARWIFWPVRTAPHRCAYMFAALDGSRTFVWESECPSRWSEIVWNSSSTAWVAATSSIRSSSLFYERSTLDAPARRVSVRPRSISTVEKIRTGDCDRREIVFTHYPPADEATIAATDVDLISGREIVRHYALEAPPPLQLLAAELSPQGSRLALVACFEPTPSILRLFPWHLRPQYGPSFGIWTCRTDGTAMRLACCTWGYAGDSVLRWSPDGTRLACFARPRTVRTLSVD